MQLILFSSSLVKAILSVLIPESGFYEAFTLSTSESMRLILFSVIAITIIASLSIYFNFRLRKANRLLAAKNTEIEDAVSKQTQLNAELARQKDLIARELADSERLYAILIESASDGISFYDRDNNLILSNTAFYSILGMTVEEYNSVFADELLHPESINYTSDKLKALKEKGEYSSEIRLRHKAGHYIVLSTRTVQIKNDTGEVIGSLSISRDITDMTKTKQELIDAKEMAEASNRLKSSFLANISHEIRTPLNSVVGFSNLLMMDDVNSEQKAEYCDLINYNSERLLQIIGDIIDLSRLESAQVEISYAETSVNSIVSEIREEVKNIITHSEKPVVLRVNNELHDASDLIFTDRMWLKRVLRHLLDNAVKFTLEGEVELTYSQRNNDIVFSVKDTGIGINKEYLGRIFEQFNQEANGHHRPFEGLGVGLTLTKHVLDRLGGHIYVSSEKGIGSEFTISIPYRHAGTNRQANTVKKLQTPSGWNNIRCLVVDDNKDVLLYLTRILLDSGVQTVTAKSGPEAIEQIRSDSSINMVLLDMQMPEMNGIETARQIRKMRGAIPIIAQTAFIFEDDKKQVLQAGCDACLVKPIRRDNLITVMSAFIAKN